MMDRIRKNGGYAAGTRVLCADGPIPAEFIEIGDRVITRDAGIARVTNISRRTLRTNFIRFKPYALDETGPTSDLVLTQDQTVLVRNWRAREAFGIDCALVEAALLVDNLFIEMTEPREEVLFQISFASPHILYLEGIEVGSADATPARGTRTHAEKISKSLSSTLLSGR